MGKDKKKLGLMIIETLRSLPQSLKRIVIFIL